MSYSVAGVRPVMVKGREVATVEVPVPVYVILKQSGRYPNL